MGSRFKQRKKPRHLIEKKWNEWFSGKTSILQQCWYPANTCSELDRPLSTKCPLPKWNPELQFSELELHKNLQEYEKKWSTCTTSHCGPSQGAGRKCRTQDQPLQRLTLHSPWRFPDLMEAANATVSSECFYGKCWFFALFMKRKYDQVCEFLFFPIPNLPLVIYSCILLMG